MRLSESNLSFLADNKRSDKSPSIRCDVDAIDLSVMVDRDKLLYPASLPQKAHISNEFDRLLVDADRLTIEEDKTVLW